MLGRLKALHKKYIPEPEPIVKVLDNLALVLYALFIFEAFLRTTTFVIDWHPYYHLSLKVILILLVVAKSFLKVFNDLWVYILLFICAIGYAMAYLQGNHGILLEIILFTVLLKDIDFRKIAKVFFVVIGISLVCIFVASKRGMLTDLTYVRNEGEIRHSFGINYPTDFAAYVLFLSLAWVFVRNEKISFIEIVVMGFVTRWVWINCYARASVICMILLIAGVIMCKVAYVVNVKQGREKENNSVFWKLLKAVYNIVTWLVTFAVPVCFIFSLLSAYKFDVTNPMHYKLNELLSDRLRLGKATFDTYDVKLFGQEIEMHGNGGTTLSWLENSTISTGYNFIDSSYLNIMFRYGFFVVVFTVLLLWVTSILAKKRKDYITLFIIAIIAVHSIIEHHMLDLHYNPFIFIMFSGYFSKVEKYDEKKLNLIVVKDKKDTMNACYICEEKRDNVLKVKDVSKKVFAMIVVYAILSSFMFLLDKKVSEHIVYDVACPVEKEDIRNDISSKDIASFVEYIEYDGQYKFIRQNFYTMERITGIELWLRCEDMVAQEYSVIIYNQAWEVLYCQTFFSDEIVNGDFTRIIFDGFYLEQGELYFFSIGATDYTVTTVNVGTVPKVSFVASDLYINEEPMDGRIMCFNLIYDYQGWGFINWMVINIMCVFMVMSYIKVVKEKILL